APPLNPYAFVRKATSCGSLSALSAFLGGLRPFFRAFPGAADPAAQAASVKTEKATRARSLRFPQRPLTQTRKAAQGF
ncbi:hypothetical protein HMPREF0322_03975, partial [Desulfitobacterium hafniense DP7]